MTNQFRSVLHTTRAYGPASHLPSTAQPAACGINTGEVKGTEDFIHNHVDEVQLPVSANAWESFMGGVNMHAYRRKEKGLRIGRDD